jgi:hypothetical protein
MSLAYKKRARAAEKAARMRLLVCRAMAGYEAIPSVGMKIELLLAVAEVLPEAPAQAARSTAWTLRAGEEQQLKFAEMIGVKL